MHCQLKIKIPLVCMLLVSGCSSIDKKECENSTGLADGKIAINQFERRQRLCERHQIVLDRSVYEKNYSEGLKSYCTDSHFYFLGEMGFKFDLKPCPESQNVSLEKSFDDGQKLLALKERVESLRKRKEEFLQDRSLLADIVKSASVLSGENPGSNYDREIEETQHKIASVAALAPDRIEYCEYEAQHNKVASIIVPTFVSSNIMGKQEAMETCSREKISK